uniref:Uncharacterized protein n=1 Tax=viral metagenome TaxID=1070528 RepID=A0A6C0K3P2_9ZZZZ
MSSEVTLSDGSTIDSEIVNQITGGAYGTITNSNQLTSLTATDIAALIAQIDSLISTQTYTVINTQSLITMLQTSIDTPVYGLTAIYESTIQSYSTAVIDYYTKMSLIDRASHRLSTLYSTLSAVIIQEQYDISTMNGYAAEYSTIIRQIETNDISLNAQISLYRSLSTTGGSFVNNYLEEAARLQIETDPTTLSTISTTLGNDTININLYNTLMQSTLYTISTMTFISSSYQEQSNSYTTDPLYNRIRNSLFDPVTGLIAQQGDIINSITTYENQLFWLNQSTISAYSKLNNDTDTFFSKKFTQIKNKVLKIKYSVQEWEAFVEFVTSQLALEKLQLYNTIDFLSYQNIQANDPNIVTLINSKIIDQTKMQTIINNFNPIPNIINNILRNIDAEILLQSSFIGFKKELTKIEINVFSSPTLKESYRATYVPLTTSLDEKAAQIVASQNDRISLIQIETNSLMTVFNSQWSNIQSLNQYVTFILPNPIYRTGYVAEVPFNSNPTEFNVLLPLNYS